MVNTPQLVLLGLSCASVVASAIASAVALIKYSKKPGASLVGFGFAEYYWGDMRREHKGVFRVSLGGMAACVLFIVAASFFRP